MNDKDWEQLAELLNKVIQIESGTWQEKKEQLQSKMEEFDGDLALDEIIAWFPAE